uniref:SKIP_SNW domain-containing protein n=1 Tax=Onchocerca volvulus TaxID=6282 RepID=A0A8R1XY53_ONCVO
MLSTGSYLSKKVLFNDEVASIVETSDEWIGNYINYIKFINEKFAKLAESLYLADHIACEAVKTRAQMERRDAQNKKVGKEKKMRAVASKVRQEHIVLKVHENDSISQEARERDQIRRGRLSEHRHRFKKGWERDISEKIVFGLPDVRTRYHETQFDQSKGLGSGDIAEKTYSAYNKPCIISTNRFVPDKGFSAAESGAVRNVGPADFEKEEEDIFSIG